MYAFFDNCGHVAHGLRCWREPWHGRQGSFLLGTFREVREKKMATTSQGAKKLRAVMQEMGGEISVDGAREILENEGLTGRDLSFGLIYGQGRRKWWTRSEDKSSLVLVDPVPRVNGPGPGSPAGAGGADGPAGAILALASPEEQLRELGIKLGASERAAAAMASYLGLAVDLNDPVDIWTGLSACTEIPVSLRRRIHASWCRLSGLPVDQELAEDIKSALVEPQAGAEGSGRRPKRWTVVNGPAGPGIFPAEADDEGALSWSQAVQWAQVQQMSQAPDPGNPLDKWIPGLSNKIAELLIPSPRERSSGGGIPVDMNGAVVNLSEEAFIRLQDVEQKRAAIGLVKENLPKLWEVAQDLATATDRAFDKTMAGKASEVNAECVSCKRRFHAPAGTTIFKCAGCGVSQDLDSGQVFEEELENQQQQEPAIPWQRCLNCGSNFQSAGFRCPECAFEPSRLVTDAAL